MEEELLMDIKNLSVSYHTYAGEVQCVRDASFHINKGECVAIVGESGCGKSVTVKSLMGLIKLPFGEIKPESKVLVEKNNILEFGNVQWRDFRGNKVSMVFQDALAALNPTMRIGKQIKEVILNHRNVKEKEAQEEAINILKKVGITDAEKRSRQYPHEFSGGMRQRVMIAIAIAGKPDLLIADEPTTALDVTIQGQILDLMKKLQEESKMSLILVTHDLGVVAGMAQWIVVMYAGMIVEQGCVRDIFYSTRHPYTEALLKSQPGLTDDKRKKMHVIEGTPPNLLNPPKGCPFCYRCGHAMAVCRDEMPETVGFGDGHQAACWLYDEEVKAYLHTKGKKSHE